MCEIQDWAATQRFLGHISWRQDHKVCWATSAGDWMHCFMCEMQDWARFLGQISWRQDALFHV